MKSVRIGVQNLVILGLTVAVVAGCSHSGRSSFAPPAPEVTVVTVQPRDIPAKFEYVGQIAGIREIEVRPRVSGILERWNYVEGSTVQAGQSLFTIDPAPFTVALARAEADLASADAERYQAQRNAARLKPLWEAKAVSQKDYDDAVSTEQITEAKLKSAQAAVNEAKLNLGYSRVEAPISGITSRALMSEGSLVEAEKTLLTTISQIDPIRVIFSFSESEYLKFTRGVSEGTLKLPKDGKFDASLKLADGSEYPGAGKVDFTDVRVDPKTGTMEARAVIQNRQHLLRPGQFARVLLSGAIRPNALAVPQRAVLEGPNTKMVMTVNDKGLVEPRPVQVGEWTGEEWIISGGLKQGDKVIVDGFFKAPPGTPVKMSELASKDAETSEKGTPAGTGGSR